MGDDQSPFGVYGDLDEWCNGGLWDALLQMYPFDTKKFEIDDAPLLRKPARVEYLKTQNSKGSERKIRPANREQSSSNKNTSTTNSTKNTWSTDFSCRFYSPAKSFYKSHDLKPVQATLVENIRITADDWVRSISVALKIHFFCFLMSSDFETIKKAF